MDRTFGLLLMLIISVRYLFLWEICDTGVSDHFPVFLSLTDLTFVFILAISFW